MRLSDFSRRDVRYVKRRNRLVERHLFLVLPVARRLKRSVPNWIEFDELMADGALGLLHAAIRFDRRRGVPFARFATRYVRAAMIDGVRWRTRGPMSIADCDVAETDPNFARFEDRSDAWGLVAHVPSPRRRLAVVLYFFDQLTMKRVARRLDVSEARVSRLVGGAVATMRRAAAA